MFDVNDSAVSNTLSFPGTGARASGSRYTQSNVPSGFAELVFADDVALALERPAGGGVVVVVVDDIVARRRSSASARAITAEE
jgi:hypothetical protein